MKSLLHGFSSLLAVAVLSAGLAAQSSSAGRYDADIQARAKQQFASKAQFHSVSASVEDGVVTLTGSDSMPPRRCARLNMWMACAI
jgi:hypothetical protein